jgi:citrate lyase beta subunit
MRISMRARRALLYMPGDDERKITKATSLNVDCICMDMEDGVAWSQKEEARSVIANALLTKNFGRSERLVRINRVGSGLEEHDLAAVIPGKPDGIVIPKVESSDQIRHVCDQISELETESSIPQGKTGLIAIVETVKGILNLEKIVHADPRLSAIVFGAEDLASDLGAVRTADAWEVFYARSAVVLHAAGRQIQAIDMVYVDFQDESGLRKEALAGFHMGYSGKQIIHPNQVIPVQESFTPTGEAIQQAKDLLEAFNFHLSQGVGAFAYKGKMVDAPVIKAAERTLDLARVAGLL